MLAQSVLALDSNLNVLCGKLDNWDHSRRKDEAVVGSQNDEIIDKLATLPDLLTSIIQHCKYAVGNCNKTTGNWAEGNQQETGTLEFLSKDSIVYTEGEDGSSEMESNNTQQIAKPPEAQFIVFTNVPANIEEQVVDVKQKPPCEKDLRTKHHRQLTRQQKKKLKKNT
ncbi:hypothetical protein NDU88_006207 [Pleurodeles waltl]|uniref:Uncharacterized protein n=1 Tax=Pleurodeles waltl TaxID=8319 RepID=A0AAV7WWZ6_PLEWA|nr:hypothetical protein NDU88_006207 [Pleurodeles waltl]